jgi:integrase
LILTAIFTGLRRSELIGMRVLERGSTSLRCATVAKGGEPWAGWLPAPAAIAVLHAADRLGLALHPGSPVFPISGASFYAWLRRFAEVAGLGRVTPHCLRHTGAKLRRDSGATVEEVSRFLGHSSIATTAIYLRSLASGLDEGWVPVAGLLALGGDG